MSVVNDRLTVKLDGTTKYGISLNDLSSMIGSGYNDLVAIICDDGGRQRDISSPSDFVTEYDEPDALMKSGASVLNSAFALSDLGTDGTRASAMPKPSDCSFKTFTSLKREYDKGDLILGRRPKWNIWADGINVGKIVEPDGFGRYVLRYNIFKNPWRSGMAFPTNSDIPGYWPTGYTAPTGNRANDKLPDLLAFQNYTNQGHAPRFEIGGEFASEWHNGVPVRCDSDTALNCFHQQTLNQIGVLWNVDRIFRDDPGSHQTSGTARLALGNIVDWWLPCSNSKHYNTFYGIAASVSITDESSGDSVVISQAWKSGSTALGLETSDADKCLYRDGTDEDGNPVDYPLSMTGALASFTWNRLVAASAYPTTGTAPFTSQIKVKAELTAVRNPYPSQTVPPTEDDELVYLDRIFPAKEVTLNAQMDPANSEVTADGYLSSRYRFLLANDVYSSHGYHSGGFEMYSDGSQYSDESVPFLLWPAFTTTRHGTSTKDAIMFSFYLMRNGGTIMDYLKTSPGPYDNPFDCPLYALWDITCVNPSTGKISARFKRTLPIGMNIDTSYGIPADNIWSPGGTAIRNGSTRYKDKALISYVTASDLNLTAIPDSTTARVRILPEEQILHFYDINYNSYNATADAFLCSASRNFYFNDYDPSDEYRYFSIFNTDGSRFWGSWPEGVNLIVRCERHGESDRVWTITASEIRTAFAVTGNDCSFYNSSYGWSLEIRDVYHGSIAPHSYSDVTAGSYGMSMMKRLFFTHDDDDNYGIYKIYVS